MVDQTSCGEYADICANQAARSLLGPYRPSACTCQHGVRRTLDDCFPPPELLTPSGESDETPSTPPGEEDPCR